MRFSVINCTNSDISKQVPPKTSTHLENDGFIRRALYPKIPLRA